MTTKTNGLERVRICLAGNPPPDRPPVLPILHSALPRMFGVPLGEYFTRADCMAEMIITGYRTFGYDGVQLSSGVTAEAEGLGAVVEKPADAAPILKTNLLAEERTLTGLDPSHMRERGSLPVYFDAVSRVVREIGDEAFVLTTLRGPLLTASQLRGVTTILLDCMDEPAFVEEVLDFAVALALDLGAWLLETGAHGVLLGEAVCSPNFIAPDMYRDMVKPRHARLVKGLKDMGWEAVGLHICGAILPIAQDIVETGVDFLDVDYQVEADAMLAACAGGRAVCRGNLDPSSVFRYGTEADMVEATRNLLGTVRGRPWLVGSGCDIPPGTAASQLAALMKAVEA